MNANIPPVRKLRFGPFSVDLRSEEVYKGHDRVKLQGQPFQVLKLLLANRGEVVTREDLRQKLWPTETAGDFDAGLNGAIKKLRDALGDSADHPIYVETLHRRGYRFIALVVEEREPDGTKSESEPSAVEAAPAFAKAPTPLEEPATKRPNRLGLAVALVLILATAGVVVYRLHALRARSLSPKDTVVLTDFDNSTGDAIFDGTLKTALTFSLRQSPFLSVLADRDVTKILQEMTLPPGTKLTPKVARELCQRAGSKVYIAGSIGSLGTEYVLGLKAVNCQSEDTLVQEQGTAASKEKVLGVLDQAAFKLREELGESLASLQKFDVPLTEGTTSSLEALQAVSLSHKALQEKGSVASIRFLKRAIELDSNFALAYADLAGSYNNMGEYGLAAETAKKAYDLRDRTSEREKLHIQAVYYMFATAESEKARETLEMWAQSYPNDPDRPIILINLAGIHMILGQWEQAKATALEAHQFRPKHIINLGNLGLIYLALDQPKEAKGTIQEAFGYGLEGAFLHQNAYFLAFLEGDTADMERQVEWAKGKPGEEDILLAAQADTEAYHGRMKNAGDWSRRATESAQRADSKATAALYQAIAAVRDAEVGSGDLARLGARSALKIASDWDVKILAAMALARAGDATSARGLAEELSEFPLSTTRSLYWLPIIRATIEMERDPVKALRLLEPTVGYDLGEVPPINCLCSLYVRGEAYLRARRAKEAAAEFQKMLDHRGIALNSIQASLAHLGLARAYAMEGDTGSARVAYADFLGLWKDADPGVPILREARAEYTKLP
jgi:DNA-binding winged helix-turn-helix (wHTH) protein/tetratricopeptide (TPR) repeat protein